MQLSLFYLELVMKNKLYMSLIFKLSADIIFQYRKEVINE